MSSSAKLLLVLPAVATTAAPSQQLHLLRSATSATATTASASAASTSTAPSTASPRPKRCRCTSPESHFQQHRAASVRPPFQPSLRLTSPADPSLRPSTPPFYSFRTSSPRAFPRRARQIHSATFGTATASKQTAFPRHGKAVAPQPKPALDDIVVTGMAGFPPGTPGTAAPSGKPPAGDEAQQAESTVKGAPGEGEAQDGAKATASTATTTPAQDVYAAPTPAERPVFEEPPIDLSEDQGSSDIVSKSTFDPTDLAGIASAAAAAAAYTAIPLNPPSDMSAAEALGIPERVIELGPPASATGAIDAILGGPPRPSDSGAPSSSPSRGDGSGTAGGPPDGRGGGAPRPGSPLSPFRHPPHLTPPPYVHHFDSYSLVNQLQEGGYSREHAITAMKAVRGLLAVNLDLAQSGLVSKADVENEAYLFKAACAELGVEVRNNRRRADEQMRQQRTLLQHEVDIAGQSVTTEIVTLNDTVKGLFNDRKQAVREEQKALESSVQKLNYKITTMLHSEMRSQIEGLRWVLIRRSVLGIIFMAIMTLSSFRYASYQAQEKAKAAEAAKQAREKAKQEAEARMHAHKDDLSESVDAAEILTAN